MDWQSLTVIASVVLYGLAFYNCYHILNARQSPAASITWIWINLALPFIGVPLYLFLGRVRIDDYGTCAGDLALDFPERFACLTGENSDSINQDLSVEFKKVFSSFGPVFKPYCNESVALLVDGEQTFSEIFSSIKQAKHYILVQYYILRSDKLGIELKDLLVEKVKEGVRVYLLYDDMGSFWLSRNYIRDLKKAGVRVARFLPFMSFRRFFLINFRNHRKLVVVDGDSSFTGGLNVGEEYVGSRFNKKTKWRDTHLKITGPATRQLEEIFYEDWHYATDEILKSELKERRKKVGDQSNEKPSSKASHTQLPVVQVIPSGPNDSLYIGMLVFKLIISQAKKRLWIATPYFVPDENLQRDLELAVLRGVDVKIIIPRKSDNRVVHWVSLTYAEQMQRHGIQVYLYKEGFSHQKIVCVDDHLSAVGTSNFDNRALYLNFESMVAVFDQKFNQKVSQMLKDDLEKSRPMQARQDRFIRKIIALPANGARLLAPLM